MTSVFEGMRNKVMRSAIIGLVASSLVLGCIMIARVECARSIELTDSAVRVSHPYFRVDPARRREILERARHVEKGDTEQEVVNSLGLPSHDSHRIMDIPQPRIRIREMSWYLTIWEKDLVNEINDEYITVYVNEDSHMVHDVAIKVRDDRKPTSGQVLGSGK